MQKNNNKELISIEDKKVNTNLCYEEKVLSRGKFSAVATGGQGGRAPHFC